MIRLIGSELLRFRSRRLVVVLMGASLIGAGIGVVIAAFQSTPPTAEAVATASARAREEVAACLVQDWEGVGIQGSLEEFCEDNFGDPAQYMGSHLKLADLPGILEGISSITSIMGLVVGASAVAVSWQTGTISTILTWEPRRLRWFAARVLVIAVGVLVMTLAIVAFLSAGLALAANARLHRRDGRRLVVRRALDLAAGRPGGFDLRGDRRGGGGGRPAHCCGARRGVRVDGGDRGLIRGFRPLWSPWLLGDNLVSFLSWSTTDYQASTFETFTVTPGRAVFVILGYTAITLLLGFTFIRVRDVQ